jgi:hypothetical protein
VGVPARPVDRAVQAEPCFDAYGMPPADTEADPILCAIESLRAELCELEGRVGQLMASRSDTAD